MGDFRLIMESSVTLQIPMIVTTDEYGASNNGDGQFNSPTSIAKNRSTFFVVDSGNDRVQNLMILGSFN